MVVEAVSFDGDGTLWDINAAARVGMGHVLELLNAQVTSDQPITVGELEQTRTDLALRHLDWPMARLRKTSFASVLLKRGKRDEELVEDLWAEFLQVRRAATQCYPDVMPTLTELRGEGIATVLLSNGNTFPEHVGLDGLFNYVQVSEVVGIRKPDPKAFDLMTTSIQRPSSVVLHVGDDFNDDYLAARKFGLQAVWLSRNGSRHEGAPTIGTLDRIAAFVATTYS